MKQSIRQISIALLATVFTLTTIILEVAYAEGAYLRIDQVYTDLPDMQVYFHLLNNDGGDVPNTISPQELLLQYNGEKAEISNVRSASAEKRHTFFLLDISNSMPDTLFEEIKSELLLRYKGQNENEKYTLITFGDEVTIRLQGNESAEDATSVIEALDNSDTHTVLYDAVSELSRLTSARSEYTMRLVYLFTDGEDWSVGGHTEKETQDLVKQSGVPVYAFGNSSARKQDLDSLSELARSSGGIFKSVSAVNLNDALQEIDAYSASGFVADVQLLSNAVSSQTTSITLQFENSSDQRTLTVQNWQEDSTAPTIANATVDGNVIHVVFSEGVTNSTTSENCKLICGKKQFIAESIVFTSNKTADIQFAAPLYDGEYTLSITGITDMSVEQNALSETYPLTVTDNPYTIVDFLKNNAIWLVLGVLIVCAVVVVIVLLRHKKTTSGPTTEIWVAGKNPEKYRIKSQGGKEICLSVSGRNLARRDIRMEVVGTILIGRSASCDLSIDDEQISRRNTEITLRGEKLYVKNISTTNGTMLNGLMLNGERELHSSDTLVMGDTRIVVTFM